MKKLYKYCILGILLLASSACKKDFLERKPQNIILEDQVWNDPVSIAGLLANYYDRLPTDMGVDGNWRNMADYDDAMWSGLTNEEGRNNIASYATTRWQYWDYGLIRDINLALDGIQTFGTKLSDLQKTQFSAELRFIRAFIYFELVKRMGGVPIVTTQLIYDYSGDPTPLQKPRNKESEVYDFIASEMDDIKDKLGNSVSSTKTASYTRASKYTALALKSRAMLYAGSIAKYGGLTPTVVTAGGEVGIPAARANEYFQKSLDASKEIINSGYFSLYKVNSNLGENFYEATTKKLNNREVIFVRDFLSPTKRHFFSYDNIVRSIREDNLSSSNITPSLNLVESFEYLDGSSGALKTMNTAGTDFIYYDKTSDIFANKDARLYGTVIYPGTTFKGLGIEMQAGVMTWDAATSKYITSENSNLATVYADGKTWTAAAGPHRSVQEVSNTGFYLRKFIDSGAGTSTRGIQSDVWWIWFRLGEIYLNGAEAAFELSQTGDALTYTNAIRERAGFGANSLTSSTLTLAKIRNERRCELAFEDHRVWDLKRWRQADKVWNGSASNPDASVYALYPYRIIRPGDAARDGKFVFVKSIAPRFKSPRFFQLANYYSAIDQTVLNNNPKLVRNPFQ